MSHRTTAKMVIVGALIAGGLTALAAGTAHADPFAAQPHNWCPPQPVPFAGMQWDMSVCHTWYEVPFGQGNVRMVDLKGNTMSSFISADIPAPIFTPPPPPPPPPPHPFCTPRGNLIIIPPICDEIGVPD
ncbi:hypothetical protein BOO86_00580 [Mycobacterium sp. CBMA 234]|uniref:hypothetical protein n=1 Tax=Mycolicibacterium sp. CBMA 234 TaxID=1918495 RepID=UPI0012DBE92E|nr:hypothetical protein [Mycolicibacterium sp. CBMA 234]MUL62942.1 hypothetical protein [Mycolicibacterium sp. CBMA 234]